MTTWKHNFLCLRCKHFHDLTQYTTGLPNPLTCDAFPDGDGIPQTVLNNEVDHRQRIDGDRGITFTGRTSYAQKEGNRIFDTTQQGT